MDDGDDEDDDEDDKGGGGLAWLTVAAHTGRCQRLSETDAAVKQKSASAATVAVR